MRILFVSDQLIGATVVQELIKEGHDLKLFIGNPDWKKCYDGIAVKVTDWKNELDWVGKDGLIVFDDITFNGEQDVLRNAGYSVFGGDSKSDKLELDRQYFQDILQQYGVKTLPSYDFITADEAIDFVRKNLRTWVVKQNSHVGMLNYVGERDDAKDVLDILNIYKNKGVSPVHLQQRVRGIEMGVARYFNGNDWVGPIEINLEHKNLCNGNIGPLTAEMGTVIWYDDNDSQPLFKETLAKIKDYLIEINYKGDIDINCIVNADGAWPLEATMRFGTPSTELQCELHRSPWGDFLKAIADGRPYELDYYRGYGVVVSVAVPPFPYAPEVFGENRTGTSEGVNIFYREDLSQKEKEQIHFVEAAFDQDSGHHYIAGDHGYPLYVTGHGPTPEIAKEEAYAVVKKLIIPKMIYRTDIGDDFINGGLQQLKDWGWVQ